MSALDALAAAVPKAKPNAAGSPAAPAREPCAPAAAAIPTAEVRAGSKEFAKISSFEIFDTWQFWLQFRQFWQFWRFWQFWQFWLQFSKICSLWWIAMIKLSFSQQIPSRDMTLKKKYRDGWHSASCRPRALQQMQSRQWHLQQHPAVRMLCRAVILPIPTEWHSRPDQQPYLDGRQAEITWTSFPIRPNFYVMICYLTLVVLQVCSSGNDFNLNQNKRQFSWPGGCIIYPTLLFVGWEPCSGCRDVNDSCAGFHQRRCLE